MRTRVWPCVALLALAGCDRVFGIGDPYEDARGGSDAAPDTPAPDDVMVNDASLVSQAIVHFTFDGTMLDDQNRTTAFCGATGTCGPVTGGHVGFGSLGLFSNGCAKFLPNAMPAQFTLAMWVYPNAAGSQQTLIARKFDVTSSHLIWHLAGSSNTQMAFTTFDGTDVTVTSTLKLQQNTWQHFVVTYDGANLAIFANAQPVGMMALSLATGGYAEAFLGCDAGAGGGFFTGNIDDVFVFDRALGLGEIAELYNRM